MIAVDPNAALRELRALVALHLESSPAALRATELLDALSGQVAAALSPARRAPMPDDHARAMFGCTAGAIDEALAGKSPRDVAMYAMGTLSNAQEYIHRSTREGSVEWSVADHDANTIRQLINVAKYAIDRAVPR
jgi:hypothetical protein